MVARTSISLALTAALLALAGCGQRQDAQTVSYRQDIQPILDRYCAECHTGDGAGVEASGFRTDSYATVMQGTRFGPMIEPGEALSSSFYRLVSGREIHPSIRMPQGKDKLLDAEVRQIELWIKQGAQDN
jgi:mono/diheme cytochrome c family protein